MTPVQTIALLVFAVLLWKRLVRIVSLFVTVPLLYLGKALLYIGFPRVGALCAIAGVSLVLWLNDWVQGDST